MLLHRNRPPNPSPFIKCAVFELFFPSLRFFLLHSPNLEFLQRSSCFFFRPEFHEISNCRRSPSSAVFVYVFYHSLSLPLTEKRKLFPTFLRSSLPFLWLLRRGEKISARIFLLDWFILGCSLWTSPTFQSLSCFILATP